jgi:ATP-dependent protease HslVU (ClpYQ) peptidase subunit
MTILAYRNGVLASDSRVTFNDMILSDNFPKIAQSNGVIGGASGDADATERFVRWIKKGADKKTIPDKGKYRALMIKLKGDNNINSDIFEQEVKITYIENGDPMVLDQEFVAIGSGAEIAIGAMEMGASAEKAVTIATKRMSSCGGPLQVKRFW